MSTISNSFNVQNENIITSNTNKQFEECKENCNSISTIICEEPTYFMQANFIMSNNQISSSVTNQMEEFSKIQSEIKYINFINLSDTKTEVEMLAVSKMSKYRKMEDLRRLIERVAEEDSHRCRYLDTNNSRYFISDKSSNSLSSLRYKVSLNNNNILKKETYSQFNQKKISIKSDIDCRSSVLSGSGSSATTTRCSEETGTGGASGEGDRAPGKQGIQTGPKVGVCKKQGLCDNDTDEHFNNLYCYWQDNLPVFGLLCESK
jgi:hypothetical protein